MFDAFLLIDGIPGESLDSAHTDQIEVLSFSHAMAQPVSSTASSAGGGTTERTEHEDFVVVKHLDKSSPKLYEACSTGLPIAKVTLSLCRSGGDKLMYMEYAMEEVIISHVAPGGNGKGGDGLPTESVSFNYGKIKWTYTQQKRPDGKGGGNVTGSWDLTKGKK